jgi:hypothetical protein
METISMRVTKRDGELEEIAFDKILLRIKKLGQEANIQINYQQLVMKVIDQLYDKISTTKIDELAAEQCASLSTLHPDYGTLAGRIIVSNHQKNTVSNFSNIMMNLYNFTDIEKGWNTLLRLMLILMPHHGDDDSDSVEKFMECIRNVKSFFDLSVNRLTSLRINNRTEDEMTLVINKLIDLFYTHSRSDSQKLYSMLLRREDKIMEWFIDYYRTGESREVRQMRYLTLEIIKQCAQYFVEHLAKPDVKYLAYIAFGHNSINFQQSKIMWLDKIKEIPREYLSGNSDLWIKATRLVGATSTGNFYKNYDIYP